MSAAVSNLEVRPFEEQDWAAVWEIVHDVVVEQETFPYEPTMTEGEGRSVWVVGPPGRTTVAHSGDRVVGTANTYANRPGPGKHIASGSFMVSRSARGCGVGRALVRDALAWAGTQGFVGMQFNAVVEGNEAAESPSADLGFVTIGTVPGGSTLRRGAGSACASSSDRSGEREHPRAPAGRWCTTDTSPPQTDR